MRQPESKLASGGGTDYDYGAQDFGDLPVDTSSAKPPARAAQREGLKQKKKAASTTKKAA